MARSRRQARGAGSAAPEELICPECGKTFTRAASLGAHRNRAHGVAGASKSRTSRQAPATQTSVRARRAANTRSQPATTAASGRRSRDGRTGIDRNQLLQTLFPNGLPPREDVIARVGSWLDEAERLTKL
jgi:hypothetical protein